MSENDALIAAVLRKFADAPGPLLTTKDLLSQIDAMDAKLESLNFQKQHANSLGRRTSLIHAINALIKKRNATLALYKRTVGIG